MSLHRLFVYGTLKEGHRNAAINQARRVPGRYLTAQPYPLYVLGSSYLPWLSEEPGQGLVVEGELYEADAAQLARMDALEQLDKPVWYRRRPIVLFRVDGGPAEAVQAEAYFGDPARVAMEVVHAGPVACYTLELAARFAAQPGVVADARADAAAHRDAVSTRRY